MNKKDKLRKKTWEYFIKQKFNEISKFTAITLSFIFVPYFLGRLIVNKFDSFCSYDGCGTLNTWAVGFWGSVLVLLILWLLIVWLKSNWKKAKKRAKEDLLTAK